jgi:hypothetical protein
MNKKHNLPAVNKCYLLLCQSCPECFRKLPENFSGNFLSREQFDTSEFIRMLLSLKVQIHDCKQVFYFHKPHKVPGGNFLWRKIPRKIFLIILVNFRNFFRQGNISENSGENVTYVVIYKSTITDLALIRENTKIFRKAPSINIAINFFSVRNIFENISLRKYNTVKL